jgi:hypothetical protein
MATAANGSRLVRNELLFREVNEQIERLGASVGVGLVDTTDFLCECGSESCTSLIGMTLVEYEAIRRVPTRFFAVPGHEDPAIERLVEEIAGYVVLEKTGTAGETAAALDPRTRRR